MQTKDKSVKSSQCYTQSYLTSATQQAANG